MQNTIKELELLSEGLQKELTQKEELYIHLKNDYSRLEARYKDMLHTQESFDVEKDSQIKTMEEEINYLRKHFEVEMGLLADENAILKRELKEMMAIK